jgi:hypothetical protein
MFRFLSLSPLIMLSRSANANANFFKIYYGFGPVNKSSPDLSISTLEAQMTCGSASS